MSRARIVFIGSGKMAEALIAAVVSGGVEAKNIVASDVSAVRRDCIKRVFGVSVTADNLAAAKNADIIFLCVKPAQIPDVLDEISVSDAARRALVVSIAAGVVIRSIEKKLPSARVIRTMPNTPVAVGEGVVCLARGRHAVRRDVKTLSRLLGGSAVIVEMPEKMLDAATSISGSGPAYFYYFAEALADAARRIGFDKATASLLVAHTAAGAAAMMSSPNAKSFSDLRADVTSAGGTTAAAIKEFARARLADIVRRAVLAARKRALELSRR
ncbi:MAG: pyrroline-5-carboxylate reductase [Endomicrobiia bacterium]|nr:pyrroline-5-carboxylate reductase [Endomicrobiia bacterium]